METSYEDDSGIELLDRKVEDTSVTDKCRPIEVIELTVKAKERNLKRAQKSTTVSAQ